MGVGWSRDVERYRERRTSLARLTTGAQKVEYAWPAFMAARASVPMAAPVTLHRVRLKAMPVVMGKAKLVVDTSCAPWLPLATPWEASDHLCSAHADDVSNHSAAVEARIGSACTSHT